MKKSDFVTILKKIDLAIAIIIVAAIIGATIFLFVQFYNCASMNFLKGLAKANDMFIYLQEDDKIRIIGLTDKGCQEKYLIIPPEIDGKAVTYLGCGDGLDSAAVTHNFEDYGCINFASEKLQKIFVTSQISSIGSALYVSANLVPEGDNFVGFFLLSATDEKINLLKNYQNYNVYSFNGSRFKNANISYLYNFEDAPNNGYYWIDNCDYGNKIEFIPPDPQRAGYRFDGWYKEPECVTEWDFGTDSLPEQILGEDGKEIYQETKLYAKWTRQ